MGFGFWVLGLGFGFEERDDSGRPGRATSQLHARHGSTATSRPDGQRCSLHPCPESWGAHRRPPRFPSRHPWPRARGCLGRKSSTRCGPGTASVADAGVRARLGGRSLGRDLGSAAGVLGAAAGLGGKPEVRNCPSFRGLRVSGFGFSGLGFRVLGFGFWV